MIKIYTFNWSFFYDLTRCIKEVFDNNKIEYQVFIREVEELSPKKRNDNDLWILSFDCFYDIAVHFKKNIKEYLPKKFIYYHCEAIDKDLSDKRFFDCNYITEILPLAQQVWCYSQLYTQWFNSRGIPTIYAPLYYSSCLELPLKYKNREKTIDILLYGLINERRRNCILKLKNMGFNVFVPQLASPEMLLDGEAMNDYVSRSKIVLSVYYNEKDNLRPFDFSRLSPLICKKAVIVTEKSHDIEINKIFEERINMAEYTDIATVCQKILDNYGHYKYLAEQTFQWFKEYYKFEKCIDIGFVKNLALE